MIEAERLHKKELGGGTILDLGVYTVQLAQLVFRGEEPGAVVAGGHLGAGGCDESASITLTYSGGRTATLATHSRAQMPNEVITIKEHSIGLSTSDSAKSINFKHHDQLIATLVTQGR